MLGTIPLCIAGFLYALRYTAYELIVFSALIDGYYGTWLQVPVYTLSSILLLICIELAKPHLTFYNQ